MVASFDVLMQNFYTMSQENSEKVPSFATRLEGALNQIQLQCPGRMTDLEPQQYLRDCLFHGVRKHIHDSSQYLYNTSGVSYSQLMVATQKAKSKNEETQDCMRAKATVTTEPVEGTDELQQQIIQLMATLTMVGWGSSNNSTLSSPQEHVCGCGQSARNNNSWPKYQSGRGGPPQSAQPCSLLGLAVITVSGVMKVQIGTKDQVWREMVQPMETCSCCGATNARVGTTWPESAQHMHPPPAGNTHSRPQ